MKQPLQSISLAAEFAQFAAQQGDMKRLNDRLDRIIQQVARTSDMIDHVRRFARGDEDDAMQAVVPLANAVQSSLDLAHAALRDAAISIEVALGEPAPVVRGQALLLEQALCNLLLNARDAMADRAADAPRRIRIAATSGPEGTVRLMVADTGGGIAREVLGRIFEPFVTTKGPDKGTGLGLSICHGLIKGMGGSIEVHNATEGAVFTITLPNAAADDEHTGRKREIAEIR